MLVSKREGSGPSSGDQPLNGAAALLMPIYLFLIEVPFLWASALFRRAARQAKCTRGSGWVALATTAALVVIAIQIVVALAPSADAKTLEYQTSPTPAETAQAEINTLRRADQGADISGIKFGQYKGKNLIVVQVEALQDFVINKSYHGKAITPNLNKLARQSWYFPNTYSEVSAGNTVDAEFAVNSSLYPPVNGAASVKYPDYEIPGLPRLLRAQGYDAVTMHANDARFWNRRALYPALGFRRYWDRAYFKNRDKMWCASDESYFKYSVKVLQSEQAKRSPFYALLITMSSHTAFDLVPKARRPVKVSASDYKTASGLYVGAISYTDKAIGEFIASLKRARLWNKSIVVFYGDHSANLDAGFKRGDSRVADKILGRPYGAVDRQRIPLIIHLPGQATQTLNTSTVGQVDVMPTIAHLVGLDISKVPHVGRDAFTNAPALVPMRLYMNGGSFADDTTVFVPGLSFDDGKAYSIATGRRTTPTALEQSEFEAAKQLGVLSDAWLKSLPKRPGADGTKGAIIPGQ